MAGFLRRRRVWTGSVLMVGDRPVRWAIVVLACAGVLLWLSVVADPITMR